MPVYYAMDEGCKRCLSPSTSLTGARCISIWHVRCDQLAGRIHGITWRMLVRVARDEPMHARRRSSKACTRSRQSAANSQHFLAALKVDANPVLCTGTSATSSTTLNPSKFRVSTSFIGLCTLECTSGLEKPRCFGKSF